LADHQHDLARRRFLGGRGVDEVRHDLSQYPTACSAPRVVQQSVAVALFDHLGVLPWAPFNAGLAATLSYTGPMYDENGQPVSGPVRPVSFYGRALPRVRQHTSDEVWE
jgi:hypothetical protein